MSVMDLEGVVSSGFIEPPGPVNRRLHKIFTFISTTEMYVFAAVSSP
jgi:hypothetical protein